MEAHSDRRGSRSPGKTFMFRSRPGARLTALLVCLSVLICFLAIPASASEEGEQKLSDIVSFRSIKLFYVGSDGQPGEAVEDSDLIEKGRQLELCYTYDISEEQCGRIEADVAYDLEVSPHLKLPHLESGEPLEVKDESGNVEIFGWIYADGERAWVKFAAGGDAGTVLSAYGSLENAYFYLNCSRVDEVPPNELPIEENSNLYAMKFENNTQLRFGYAEHEPVYAKAQVEKKGSLAGKTITWNVAFVPWQNPSEEDGVTADTAFELRDTIDTSLHSFEEGSVTIDGEKVPVFEARGQISADQPVYALKEFSEDGTGMTLIFGGTKFQAVNATAGVPAQPFTITYTTKVRDEMLLPGDGGAGKVANEVRLFAEENGDFRCLDIKAGYVVEIPRPAWLTKTGKTTRSTSGDGSVTDWTVTFLPNGFTFAEENHLTLYDLLPSGSTLVEGSVKVDGKAVSTSQGAACSFCVPLEEASDKKVITYRTKVPEEMYDEGTSLGDNLAWFTFTFGEKEYKTPVVTTPVGSGDGSGTPGTAVLVKTNSGYDAATRTIVWTASINPHRANLRGATFTDDLGATGGVCQIAGHTGGMELVNGVDDIAVLIDRAKPTEDEKKLITVSYENQVITVNVGAIGAKTVTLTYAAKVCDPCVFANNVKKVLFKNRIYTDDMVIGSSPEKRSASDEDTAEVDVEVLKKSAPVYDYATGIMKWSVEVDAAGLPMKDVVVTDTLPAGLTYVKDSLRADPETEGMDVIVSGQKMTIRLGEVARKTMLTFDTKADPEVLGFGGDKPVVVKNAACMNGSADGVRFAEVRHQVEKSFANHGLVKSGEVNGKEEWIRYEVLINPYGLALPKTPSLVDTLDKRLQLDADTLRLYPAKVSGTSGSTGQKPAYTLTGEGRPLQLSDFDPVTNSFTVQLPIEADSKESYVLTYTADMIRRETDGYSNSVRFEGGAVLLGGSKSNRVSVSGGGGGGGGGGVAARKAGIRILKTDCENQKPLAGVVFTLYQWNSENNVRGLPFAQGTTGADGTLFFKVKPHAVYLLEETKGISGYDSVPGWASLPEGIKAADGGFLITAGAAGSEQKLELTNEAKEADNSGNSGGSIGGGGEGGGGGGSGQPSNPVIPGTPDESETPDGPADPEEPDKPEKPEKPNKPGKPEKPNKPGKPEKPEKPNKPGKPEKPGKSNKPEKPDKSNKSEKPGKSDRTEKPGKTKDPEKTGKREAPAQPKDGDTPEISGSAEAQKGQKGSQGTAGRGESGASDPAAKGNTGQEADGSKAPQTGDNTKWLFAVTLLSGILAAVMTGYQFRRSKKHEEK